MIIAVHLEPLELQQELLHHGLGLEGDDTVLVSLVATLEDNTVHRLLDLGEKVALIKYPFSKSKSSTQQNCQFL